MLIQTRTTCRHCHKTSIQHNVSDGIDVDIAGTLQEALDGNEKVVTYTCMERRNPTAGCFFQREADQTLKVTSAGNVLEIRVMRYMVGSDGAGRKKTDRMTYPLTGLTVGGRAYELRAVAVQLHMTMWQTCMTK